MQQDTYRHKGLRRQLVRELTLKGIKDTNVLAAIGNVPRHFFVEKAFEELAYEDRALAIGCDQTISQPYTVAYQSQLLQIKPNDRVLEIGTGSGYQACILAEIGAKVFTIERHKTLYLGTKQFLANHFSELSIRIQCFHRDGHLGFPTFAPYNKILVTAAAETVPQLLLEQLTIGGILVLPVGEATTTQIMYRITRLTETEYRKEALDEFRFVPFLKGIT